ncbi:espin-like protein [Hippocampus zosterae]|uniref:espin-like protein n=1 Tax=Hippocampus zosterae TaxID=109293 RepID=UPI00223E209F|nr:espin-like protein [Hippocampus zosterae]
MVLHQAIRAARAGDLHALRELTSRGLLSPAVDAQGAGPVHHAARCGRLECLRFLVSEHGLPPDARAANGATPAHDAAATGHVRELRWLLEEAGCSVEDRDAAGATALHLAARFGRAEAVRWLLSVGGPAMEEAETECGAVAAHYAAFNGHLDCVELLVGHAPRCVNRQMSTGTTALYLACQEGHVNVAEYLVKRCEADVHVRAHDGMTCLHAASHMGHIRVVAWLLTHTDVNPSCQDGDGATALHFAASRGQSCVLDRLLGAGAKILKDLWGGTPLHDAAENGEMECCERLLASRADPSDKDMDGFTPTQLAHYNGHHLCAKYLRAHENLVRWPPRACYNRKKQLVKPQQEEPNAGCHWVQLKARTGTLNCYEKGSPRKHHLLLLFLLPSSFSPCLSLGDCTTSGKLSEAARTGLRFFDFDADPPCARRRNAIRRVVRGAHEDSVAVPSTQEDAMKTSVTVMDTLKQPESEETVAARYPRSSKSIIPRIEKIQTATSVIRGLHRPKRTSPDANKLLADRKLLGDMKPIVSLKQSSLSGVFTGQASKMVVLPTEEANLADMDYLVPSHDEKGRPIAEWKRQVMVRQLQARLLDEEDQRLKENGRSLSRVNWRYSQAHNAILGPSGELLTEHDLAYLEQQIASLTLRRSAGEGYEPELARLAEELRHILPAAIVNISAHARFADPTGRPALLPGWCGRISGIIMSMSLLMSDSAEQPRCKMPDSQLASVFSQTPDRQTSTRGRRQRIEDEIQRFGVSVRTLKSNFEMQDKNDDEEEASTLAPDPEEKDPEVVESTSLRKERIVVLFLGHWKKSAYAVTLKNKDAAERKKSRDADGAGCEESDRDKMMNSSLGHFFKQRSAVNKMLGNWRRMISSVPSRQIRRLHRQQTLYSPEQFLPRMDGVPLEYDKLTLDLFMLGYFHILELDLPVDERKMRHLLCFEVFDHVGSFTWELVRDFHKAVLQDIAAGDREWKDGFEDLKLKFFGGATAGCERVTAEAQAETEAETRQLPEIRPLPKVIVQTPTPDEGSLYVGTDISCFSNEEICQYIDRSFAFWKEKEAEIFDFE